MVFLSHIVVFFFYWMLSALCFSISELVHIPPFVHLPPFLSGWWLLWLERRWWLSWHKKQWLYCRLKFRVSGCLSWLGWPCYVGELWSLHLGTVHFGKLILVVVLVQCLLWRPTHWAGALKCFHTCSPAFTKSLCLGPHCFLLRLEI